MATFFELLQKEYLSGISNKFMLTGNIFDYVQPKELLKPYLKKELIKEMEFEDVFYFDLANGLHPYLNKEHENNVMDSEWTIFMEALKNRNTRNAFIVSYSEHLLPNNSNLSMDERSTLVELLKTLEDPSFLTGDNMLIMLTESTLDVHASLIPKFSIIHLEYPTIEERKEMIRHLIRVSKKNYSFFQGMDIEVIAKHTAGLTRYQIEDIFLHAKKMNKFDLSIIKNRKKQIIQQEFGEVVEIMDTDGLSLDDFAGQENLKAYHREVIVQPMLTGENQEIIPKGLIYMGPPGTGKTYFAKCFAGEAGINFVELKINKILDKYVGESEKRLNKAFECFQSLAPVGVFIDEIDQVLSRGENENIAASRNIFGMFLQFLSKPENRGNIIFIAATNYPNRVDEALKRPGRFDKKIPFFPPTREERETVLNIQLKKQEVKATIDSETMMEFLDKTEGFTQAEIEGIVIKAIELMYRKGRNVITGDIIRLSMDYTLSRKNKEIDEMKRIAINECNDLEFLPETYRKKQ